MPPLENEINHLKRTIQKLESKITEKDKLTRLLAHDLRTPLSAVHNLNFLIQATGELNKKQQEFIINSNKMALEGLDLITDIIHLYKSETTKKLEFEPLNIHLLIQNSIDKSIFNFNAKEQILELNIIADLEFTTHRELLQSVINNLLYNISKKSQSQSRTDIETALIGNDLQITFTTQQSNLEYSLIDSEIILIRELMNQLNGSVTITNLFNEGCSVIRLMFSSNNK